jgi:hypothetical protein
MNQQVEAHLTIRQERELGLFPRPQTTAHPVNGEEQERGDFPHA